jgi:hypothetical protein
MISLVNVFWMYIILFAVIGFLRGWAKELLVGFAVVVAIAFNQLLERYALPDSMAGTLFWIRTGILAALVYFGYQTVISIARFQTAGRRERLQDSLFGLFLGALNGYLVMGTFWSYWHEAEYPPGGIVQGGGAAVTRAINTMMDYMPPHLLGEPAIYFAVIIVLIFILVVYV